MGNLVHASGDELYTLSAQLKSTKNDVNDIAWSLIKMHMPGILDRYMIEVKINLLKQGWKMYEISNRLNSIARTLNLIVGRFEDCEKQLLGILTGLDLGDFIVHSVDISTSTKDVMIESFEECHPKQAKALNDFLAGDTDGILSKDDIRNIKYLIYMTAEPYRSIFLDSLDKYSIGAIDGTGGFYSPTTNTVNYSYPDCFLDDPRTAYTVFFHECGHAIDNVSDLTNPDGSDSENYTAYSDAMGRDVTIREAILYDVYENRGNSNSVTSIAERIKAEGGSGKDGNIQNVIEAMKSGNTKSLSKEDLKLYNAVKNEFKGSLTGEHANFESVSDVYGGVSNNALRNGYGHGNDYWNDTDMAARELWAEFFSYNCSGAEENLNYLKEYFPESYKVLSAYAQSLGGVGS